MTKIAPLSDSISLFFAQTAPTPAGPGGGLMSFLPMILIFGAMYFFMIAPQRKKQKEHQKMLESLGSGDEVITAGGIYGEITNKKDDRYVIRIADNTKIEVGKAFIASLVRKSGEEKK
jgi:preprotein translocase subunit YajC